MNIKIINKITCELKTKIKLFINTNIVYLKKLDFFGLNQNFLDISSFIIGLVESYHGRISLSLVLVLRLMAIIFLKENCISLCLPHETYKTIW